MIVFPAIDLKDGACVRLFKGNMEQATVFNNDPVDQAKQFEQMGFNWLHVVDLNGAFAGEPVNLDIVKSIAANTKLKIQLGGGIRSIETIRFWLEEAGLERVILGTVALKDPELVKHACSLYPGKIVVGIDAKSGFVATEGWAEASQVKATELAKKFEDVGVSAIIYTDIDRDGAMQGPNIDATVALAQSVNIPVIASGGVSNDSDLKAIKDVEDQGIVGVISGRAIYEGKINILTAISYA